MNQIFVESNFEPPRIQQETFPQPLPAPYWVWSIVVPSRRSSVELPQLMHVPEPGLQDMPARPTATAPLLFFISFPHSRQTTREEALPSAHAHLFSKGLIKTGDHSEPKSLIKKHSPFWYGCFPLIINPPSTFSKSKVTYITMR